MTFIKLGSVRLLIRRAVTETRYAKSGLQSAPGMRSSTLRVEGGEVEKPGAPAVPLPPERRT
jgi:hypothetical protein